MNDLFDERASWTDYTEQISKDIFSLPINWVGNKKKLFHPLLKFISDSELSFNSVLDVFSGSGVFSLAMIGEGKKVIANDALLTASTWLITLLEVIDNPLTKNDRFLITTKTDNAQKVDLNFLRTDYNKVFKPKEIEVLEMYRSLVAKNLGNEMSRGKGASNSLETLKLENGISGDSNKVAFAMQAMCVQILQKCFMGGRYYNGQTLARVDQREQKGKIKGGGKVRINDKDLTLDGVPLHPTSCMRKILRSVVPSVNATVYNMDAIDLVQNKFIEVDLAYFDPPYGGDSSDYALMYGACEGYLRGARIQDCKDLSITMDRFKGKKAYTESFKEMLDASKRFPSWLFSFNESSFASIEEISSLIKSFNRRVIVRPVEDYGYNYRKKSNKTEREFMILARI